MCEGASAAGQNRRRLLSGTECDEAVTVSASVEVVSPTATQIATLRAALHALLAGPNGGPSPLGACNAAVWEPAGTGWLTSETVLVYNSEDVALETVADGSCETEWARSITGSLRAALSGSGSVRERVGGGGVCWG
jgi:hypothetical protein